MIRCGKPARTPVLSSAVLRTAVLSSANTGTQFREHRYSLPPTSYMTSTEPLHMTNDPPRRSRGSTPDPWTTENEENMNETAEEQQYEGWTILELMGHRRIIGYVKQQEIAGRAFLRVDIPSEPPVTQFYGSESVYCMTPTTEEIAQRACSLNRIAPINQWELPAPKSYEPVEAEIVDPDNADEDGDGDGESDGLDAWNQPLPLEDTAAGTRF